MLKDADAIDANSGRSAVASETVAAKFWGRGSRSRQRSSTPAGNRVLAWVSNGVARVVASRNSPVERPGQKNRTEMVELWSKADAWGDDSLWVFDRFYPIFVPDPAGPCMRDGLCFPL